MPAKGVTRLFIIMAPSPSAAHCQTQGGNSKVQKCYVFFYVEGAGDDADEKDTEEVKAALWERVQAELDDVVTSPHTLSK